MRICTFIVRYLNTSSVNDSFVSIHSIDGHPHYLLCVISYYSLVDGS